MIPFLALVFSVVSAGGLPPAQQAHAYNKNEQLVLLSRELARSSDQVFGTEKKGMCDQSGEDLQKLLQALKSELDQKRIPDKTQARILKKRATCDSKCQKRLCESATFKKLNSEKDKYGSAKDGV